MNRKIRRQKIEVRSHTSCLRRLKPTATHCSLLIAHCFLLLTLTLTLALSDVFAASEGRPNHMSEEILKTKKVVAVPEDVQVPYTVRRVTDGSSIDYHPEFSPDGKQIVFISKIDNVEAKKKGEFWHKTPYYLNLWLMDSDGRNKRQLTSGEFQDFAPKWTADGEKIFFVSNRRSGRWDIWSVDINGSNLARITETEGNTGLWERSHYPFPTPDGKGMVFIIYKKSHGSVWYKDMESGNIRRITSGGFGDDFPMVSPDGKEIVFKSTRQGNGDIWSIDSSGKNYRRLTYEDYPEFYPAWSPDGTKVSLTTWEPDKKESYLTMLDFGKDINKAAEELPEEKETLPEYTLIGEKELTGGGNYDDFGPSFSP